MNEEPAYRIRSFTALDQQACKTLYTDGLISGSLAENDTGLDIDDIAGAYLIDGNHFWVAEVDGGHVVGTIGVQHYGDNVGVIRRLRVDVAFRRRGIGSALLEVAVKFCRDQGYLKITLDTFTERDAALRLFEKFNFRHSLSRTIGEKQLMYFYLDLYGGEESEHKKSPGET